MTAGQIQPISATKRTAIVDILRGWALLGVVLMNYNDMFYLDIDFKKFPPNGLTTFLMNFGAIVFAAKSWTLLSVLFGYGFAVLIKNISDKGINPVRFFTVRMFWLFALAFVNCCFWYGDILKDYAFMGLILLCFYKIKARPAFITCIVLLIAIPFIAPLVNKIPSTSQETFIKMLPLYYSSSLFNNLKFHLVGTYYSEIISPSYTYTVHVAMLICFLFGLSAQRIDFFNRLDENKPLLYKIFWWSLAAALFFIAYGYVAKYYKWTVGRYFSTVYFKVFSTMIFIASALCCLYIHGRLKSFFRAMEVIGKMTLTNYMTQSVILFFVFGGVGLGLGSKMPFWFYWVLPLSIYIMQVYFSKWWLAHNNYGPIEWVWRQLSYGKRLPLRKSPPAP